MTVRIPANQMSWWRGLRIFALGCIWAGIGGLGPAAMALWQDLTTYQDYGVGWHNIGWMALAGAGPGVLGFWRKHKALLALPADVQAAIEAAESNGTSSPPPVQ